MKRLGYTIAEFCELSGLGRTTVFESIKERKLRAKKPGRRTIILEQDARDFLENLPDAGPRNSDISYISDDSEE